MYDDDGNIVAFSGSANETYNGYKSNYENIDVFVHGYQKIRKVGVFLKK